MVKGRFVVSSSEDSIESNIYADKSALVLDWLLREGVQKPEFSLREAAKDVGASVGLVQRIFGILVLKGLLQTEGIRTAKKFFFKKSKLLLENWLDHYNIAEKCKIRTYHSALQGKSELLEHLRKSELGSKVALALHSAAEAHGYKNTNLDTLEIYLLDPSIRPKLETILQLEPKERGYEVLLIEPYYKNLLKTDIEMVKGLQVSPLLLTFLDLYHFPLRGLEQAEFMAERSPKLKQIFKNGK
jgi:hypothetical protein